MKNFKHLTKNQILAYGDDALSEGDSQEIGRHLLSCEICRQSFPIPTIEQFWSTIMTESEIDDISEVEKAGNSSIFLSVDSYWNIRSNLVWGAATLVVLIGFTFLILLNFASSNKEITGLIDREITYNAELTIPAFTPVVKKPPKAESNSLVGILTPKQLKTETVKQTPLQNNISQKSEKKELSKKGQISETRGISGNCREEKGIELEFGPEKDNFIFRWKKVPNAAKYHLYISDDDEILIDEFETEKETAFLMKKSLDPLKSYKWKIIITLENGETMAGSSNKFTVNDFHTNQIKPEKKGKSDVRCSANG